MGVCDPEGDTPKEAGQMQYYVASAAPDANAYTTNKFALANHTTSPFKNVRCRSGLTFVDADADGQEVILPTSPLRCQTAHMDSHGP